MEAFSAAIVTVLAMMAGFFTTQLTYAAAPFLSAPQHAEVLFVGDMMFDRSIRQAMDEKGADFVFSCIKNELDRADVVVGNLEGPITSHDSKSVGSAVGSPDNFVFTFPEYVAPMLARHNVGAVSLGNNHILNFGYSGVQSTEDTLRTAGVGYFGEPGDLSVHEIEVRKVQLSFVGYNQFAGGGGASTTISQIERERAEGRLPIVFAHWGDEYVPANDLQKRLARRFIDAGAEIVIGAHPHVIQEHEVYAGKHVYYSLGNFVFDQYWNDAVRRGMLVRVVFDGDGVESVHESYTRLERDRRTCPTE